jgi:ADP-ribose pyrophosphatase
MATLSFFGVFRIIARSIPVVRSRAKLVCYGPQIVEPALQRRYTFFRRLHAIPYIVAMPKSARTNSRSRTGQGRSKNQSKSQRKKTTVRILSHKLVYKGPVFWITSDRVEEPSGVRVLREVVRHTGSVVVLATQDGPREPLVLLERQYRHAADDYLWELPAGRIDKGEKALAAGKRELVEETGYTARSWKRILHFYASPGFVAETMTVFWARGLRPGPAQPEEDEVIEQRLVPLSKAVKMVLGGTIKDAKTISSVLWLALRLGARQKRTKGT